MDFLVRRLFSALVTVVGVATLVFFLIHLIPGDPVDRILGDSARPADREALRTALGLDAPVSVQFGDFLSGLARLDLGDSIVSGRPVASLIAQHLPATLQLAAAAPTDPPATTRRVQEESSEQKNGNRLGRLMQALRELTELDDIDSQRISTSPML